MEQAIQPPTRRLEIQSSTLDGEEVRVWALLIDRQLVYQLRIRGQGYWELCTHDKQSFEPPRIVELKVETPPYRLWPSEAALAGQIERIRTAGGDWLKDLLPWTPLLVVASTQDDKTAQRRAILALLCAGLISGDDLDLRFALFQLRRLAYRALADIYENKVEIRGEVEPSLRRSLYAWQEEISRDERQGFFTQGFPVAFTEPVHPLAEAAARHRCVYAQMDESEGRGHQEQAMLDLVLAGQAEKPRLRAFFQGTTWGQEMAPTLIRGWFLPRYDLDMAERLAVAAAGNGELAGWRRTAWLAANALRGGALLALVYGFLFWGLMPAFQHVAGEWTGALTYGMSWLIYGILGIQILHWLRPGAPDTSLPRLRAGMFLAVVGTLLQQNWNGLFAFSVKHPWALWVLCGVLALISWQVLRAKVAAAVGSAGQEEGRQGWFSGAATKRCWAIFWRDGVLAFLLSFILVDFLSDSYLVCETGKEIVCTVSPVLGLVGGTYPSLVLLFTAILLFAGIFGQLLGGEKPLTEAVA